MIDDSNAEDEALGFNLSMINTLLLKESTYLDAEGLVTGAWADLVEHGEPLAGRIHGSGHVQVLDAPWARQLLELVKVCRKQRRGTDGLHDLLRDGPGNAEAIVCRGAPPQLVNDD